MFTAARATSTLLPSGSRSKCGAADPPSGEFAAAVVAPCEAAGAESSGGDSSRSAPFHGELRSAAGPATTIPPASNIRDCAEPRESKALLRRCTSPDAQGQVKCAAITPTVRPDASLSGADISPKTGTFRGVEDSSMIPIQRPDSPFVNQGCFAALPSTPVPRSPATMAPAASVTPIQPKSG